MKINLESVGVWFPEADGHEVGAGELSAPQLADILEPLTDFSALGQVIQTGKNPQFLFF